MSNSKDTSLKATTILNLTRNLIRGLYPCVEALQKLARLYAQLPKITLVTTNVTQFLLTILHKQDNQGNIGIFCTPTAFIAALWTVRYQARNLVLLGSRKVFNIKSEQISSASSSDSEYSKKDIALHQILLKIFQKDLPLAQKNFGRLQCS